MNDFGVICNPSRQGNKEMGANRTFSRDQRSIVSIRGSFYALFAALIPFGSLGWHGRTTLHSGHVAMQTRGLVSAARGNMSNEIVEAASWHDASLLSTLLVRGA